MSAERTKLTLALRLGLLLDLHEDTNRLRERLTLAIKKQPELLKWFRVKLTTTGTKVFLLMEPTQTFRDLTRTVQTARGDDDAIQRTLRAKCAVVVARIRTGKHGGKSSQAAVKGNRPLVPTLTEKAEVPA